MAPVATGAIAGAGRSLEVGIVAPPWVPVPPPAYGGIEAVIDALARGLAERGHRVRLFTVGSSTCPVEREWAMAEPPERIGDDLAGLSHALAAYEALDGCDVIHDHTLAGSALASTGFISTPVVTTNHGPFDPGLAGFYRRTAARVPVIAISADQASRAPAGVPVAAVIPHGIDLDTYPPRVSPRNSGGYLLCLARMSPTKGIDVAIAAAKAARRRLVIAAKMREDAEHAYYRQVIEPQLDDAVSYVGEVGQDHKVELLQGADALLNPIQWPEPFGLVMAEALACGTPVIATPNGAAPEIVTPGVNGYLAATIDDLSAAIGAVTRGGIDRRRCRRDAVARYSMQAMAEEHERFYRNVIATSLRRESNR